MADSNTVEALWARALELSEDGSVHEAVLTFEQAAQLLEKQKDQAMRTKGAERVRQLLDELIAKLGREIESHLNYLRGNLWAALDLAPGAASRRSTRPPAPNLKPPRGSRADSSGGTRSLVRVSR